MTLSSDAEAVRRARRTIVRSALLWTPLFVLFAAVAVLQLVRALTEGGGAWVGFALMALVALLASPLAFAALRDLRAEPIETEGTIGRKWRKADLFVIRGHYLMVGKRIFRVRKDVWSLTPGVSGRVHLRHYPHTNTLIAWEALGSALAQREEAEAKRASQPTFAPCPSSSGWVATPVISEEPTPMSGRSLREGQAPTVEPPSLSAPRAVRAPAAEETAVVQETHSTPPHVDPRGGGA